MTQNDALQPHTLSEHGSEAAGDVEKQSAVSQTPSQDPRDPDQQPANPPEEPDFPYSVIPERQKVALILTASFSAMISPLSSSIYLPAVNTLARDLGVSISLINLTISTYLIFQGISPSFTAAFSEAYGRRPAYLVCFLIYLGANIGLACQSSYAALMVLRCVQSAGSSGTIALSSGSVSDMSTRAQRGKYIGYASMGVTLGPALGPVIGGLLANSLGWRSIFWFLTIFCGFFATIMAIVFRETSRLIVGNGSVQPPKWNRSLLQVISQDFLRRPQPREDLETLQRRKRRPNPLASIRILADRETGLIGLSSGLLFAGYSAVLATYSSQLEGRFNYDSVQIGLCYLPLGFGSLTSRWTVGFAIDRNFKREAKRQGLEILKNRQQDISNFNIEVARLAVALPIVAAACLCVIAYGWLMDKQAPLPAILVILFFVSHLTTGSFSATNSLVVDLNRDQAASASAASNLSRCLLAAGAVALANPLIEAIGLGWTATLCAAVWLLVCIPLALVVYFKGHQWRIEKARKQRDKASVQTQLH